MDNLNELWQKCLDILKLELSSVSFRTYIEGVKPLLFEKDKLTLEMQNETQLKLIQMKHMPVIVEAMRKVTGKEIEIELIMPGGGGSSNNIISSKPPVNGIKKNYTFENFVVSENNRMAFTGALTVAELPGQIHNPLFIYSAPGLGKTHLLHAIGNYLLKEKPDASVKYVTSEGFTNEFITSLRLEKNMQEFRNKYRYLDMLLIDDIQFLTGKKETQEEFFHTFNSLTDKNAQIVISSDRPPREIRDLEERLYSRFSMGLMADIAIPELETRVAILQSKIENEGMIVPDDAVYYIAETIKSNIRDLEGALQRVKAYAKLKDREITLELTKESFVGIYDENKSTVITPEKIKKAVCDYMGVDMDDLIGTRRSRSIVHPRQIAQYLIRNLTNLSYEMIAAEFSVKDHTTIMHNCEKIEAEKKTDENTRTAVKDLTSILSR